MFQPLKKSSSQAYQGCWKWVVEVQPSSHNFQVAFVHIIFNLFCHLKQLCQLSTGPVLIWRGLRKQQ